MGNTKARGSPCPCCDKAHPSLVRLMSIKIIHVTVVSINTKTRRLCVYVSLSLSLSLSHTNNDTYNHQCYTESFLIFIIPNNNNVDLICITLPYKHLHNIGYAL